MKQLRYFILPIFIVFSAVGKAQGTSDEIFYSSLNYAIQQGQLEGVVSLTELKKHGDFGVGSQHQLSGELVMLDGNAYLISVDGRAKLMADSATLPFAAVKFFRSEKKWTVNRTFSLEELQAYLDSAINTNAFTAIKISGLFSSIRYKCYYPQQKPYPPIKQTPEKFFDSTNITGTIAGFFTPKSAVVLNSPNYHFHFINSSKTSGGHVDACLVKNLTIEIDHADGLQVKLPAQSQLKTIKLNEPIKE